MKYLFQEPEEETEGDVNEDPKLQVKGSALTPNKQVSGFLDQGWAVASHSW